MASPIGIFDSGIGGLTVFAAIRRLLPHESLLYLGDTARVPYGTKSPETIVRYSLEDAEFLMKRGVKAIVVACNTASAYGLPAIAKRFDVPILGVIEPGAHAALHCSKSRRIGVIGTAGTIASSAYDRAIHQRDGKVTIVSQACPLFVPLVEEGWLDDEATRLIAERYLMPLKKASIDTLVLGCTHYPLLKNLIQQIIGSGVTLVDSAEVTAQVLSTLLENKGLLSSSASPPEFQLWVTDLPQRFSDVAQRFLGNDLPPVTHVEL